jgi:hypothetical protein
MTASGAAMLDGQLRPPRQGDSDEGRALLLDAPTENQWLSLLAIGGVLFGRLGWWPRPAPGAGSVLVGALAGAKHDVPGRPERRPSRFADAGLTILRTAGGDAPEIWCRCDGGPHGFLSIAAHAHADALSVEVRYGGVDVLADPGTYCYHGDPEWRSYFRSTIAHNTAEIGGCSQSTEGGPFMWQRHARTRQINVPDPDVSWTAEHDGYTRLQPAASHRRSVRLDRTVRAIEIMDVIDSAAHDVRLAFHLGPDVDAELEDATAILRWPSASTPGAARLELPPELRWSRHRGETDPILGWYSPGLGRRVPADTLLGRGRCTPGAPLITRLKFVQSQEPTDLSASHHAVSLGASSGGSDRGAKKARGG